MVARSILREMGMSALLLKTAEMMKCRTAYAERQGPVIRVFSPSIAESDHFYDQLEAWRYEDAMNPHKRALDRIALSAEQIKRKMKDLVFSWSPGSGRMVGYHADPELDEHFLFAMNESTLGWRNLAGLHPHTELLGVSGALISGIVSLLGSFYLKHINFVAVGLETLEKINVPMSLTIWETRAELLESLAAFTGEDINSLSTVLDRIIVSPGNVRFFASAQTPYVPMLIRVSDEQLLRPVSSIFSNPIRGIRALLEFESPELEATIRKPRERWMKDELDAMFSGNRYRVVSQPVVLKHSGVALTDIDAAVLDTTCGCLALFQLKWQDFGTTDVRRQRSQARNFTTSVDEWSKRVKTWIGNYGITELARSLQLPAKISSFRMFAIGRQSAHFSSIGYVSSDTDLAFSTWPQFVRLRFQVGPVEHVLDKLHAALLNERDTAVKVTVIPHEITVGDQRILFQNYWYGFDEEEIGSGVPDRGYFDAESKSTS